MYVIYNFTDFELVADTLCYDLEQAEINLKLYQDKFPAYLFTLLTLSATK